MTDFMKFRSNINNSNFVANINVVRGIAPWWPLDEKDKLKEVSEATYLVRSDYVPSHQVSIGTQKILVPGLDVFVPRVVSINQVGFLQEMVDKSWTPKYSTNYEDKTDTLSFKGEFNLSSLNNLGFKKPVVFPPYSFDAERFYASVGTTHAKDFLKAIGESCFLDLKETDKAFELTLNVQKFKAALMNSSNFYNYTNSTNLGMHFNCRWLIFNNMDQGTLDAAIGGKTTKFMLDSKNPAMPLAKKLLESFLISVPKYKDRFRSDSQVQILISYMGSTAICFQGINGEFIAI